MATRTTTTWRNRAAQDLTLINLRALKKRVADLEIGFRRDGRHWVNLARRYGELSWRVRKLERRKG